MKSICLLVQSVYDFDPRVRRKAEALAAAGYSVDVLALRPAGGAKSYTLNGVTVHTISLGKKRGSLVRYAFEYAAFFLWVFFRLPALMRRRRYAVIDVNTLPDFLVFAAVVARWMGAKLILDMHEIMPEFYMSKYAIDESSRLVSILKILEKMSFDFADRVITIHEPIQDLLVRRGLPRPKSMVIMNAVDERRFASLDPRDGVHASNKFVVMYHGTLTPIYGLDVAIKALSLARCDMPGAELWILGSGPERTRLAGLSETLGLEGQVKLIGQVPASDVPRWLSQCDLGVLPFRRDVFFDYAFPNKLPEFIIAGKPVLMSRLNAICRYFSEDALAFFEPSDSADLARQMVRLFRDRHLRTRLAARATEEYAPIRWDVMKRRYLTLIDELVAVAGRKAAAESPADRVPVA